MAQLTPPCVSVTLTHNAWRLMRDTPGPTFSKGDVVVLTPQPPPFEEREWMWGLDVAEFPLPWGYKVQIKEKDNSITGVKRTIYILDGYRHKDGSSVTVLSSWIAKA